MSRRKVLLLSASNMASFPVYHYAFIQVTAVARRANIDVVCQDLLGIPEEKWQQTIQSLQERHDPAMFLITLRNTDSMVYRDYRPDESGKHPKRPYFPIERTKTLIDIIRQVSDRPISVGGFGFSLLAKELMSLLRPDFGVFGSSDEFFLRFEDILHLNYRHVANLLYFQGDEVIANKRLFFPPSPEVEYTPLAVKEMIAFYDQFPKPGFQGAPVEIMRGCNHACVFCSEPFVGGRRVLYRDLPAIMGDIELLVENGITDMYMISSELNPESNSFALQLADNIKAFNEEEPEDRQVSWFGANFLLKFDYADYDRLYASGFTGGWFDITALDDENARAMRTPYRNNSLLGYLRENALYQRKRIDRSEPGEAEAVEGGANVGGGAEEAPKVRWTMFLGNPATTMETIRRTIEVANREGLAGLFEISHIIRPLRVFDYEQLSDETLGVTFSVDQDLQRVAYQQTLPSFAYPPALLNHLGSEEAVETMFTHIGETYLSTNYVQTRDWVKFLDEQAPDGWPGVIIPEGERPSPGQAEEFVDRFLHAFLQTYQEDLAAVGLPSSAAELAQLTPFTLAVSLYGRWLLEAAIIETICDRAHIGPGDERRQSIEFFVRSILYRFNVQIMPEYEALFVMENGAA